MKVSISNTNDEIKIENVYCVGMNYHDHAKELGNKSPEEPVIFMKGNSTLVKSGADFHLPSEDALVHYEGELVIVIEQDCGRINEDVADHVILGYAVGIDYTLRAVQFEAKNKGYPWFLSKNFYGSAPISEITPKDQVQSIPDKTINLSVNDEIRQQEKLDQMIFSVPFLVSFLSHKFPLKRGDIIYTGTPKGVGEVKPGDRIRSWIDGIGEVTSFVK